MDKKTKNLIEIVKAFDATYSQKNAVFAIPEFLSKSFVSYCSMHEDLILIKKYMDKLPMTDSVTSSALTYSVISLYGKCFTDAAKQKASKLEVRDLFRGGDASKLRKTHDYLMNLRHSFVAHRGDTESEVEAAFLPIPWDSNSQLAQVLSRVVIMARRLTHIYISSTSQLNMGIQRLYSGGISKLKSHLWH